MAPTEPPRKRLRPAEGRIVQYGYQDHTGLHSQPAPKQVDFDWSRVKAYLSPPLEGRTWSTQPARILLPSTQTSALVPSDLAVPPTGPTPAPPTIHPALRQDRPDCQDEGALPAPDPPPCDLSMPPLEPGGSAPAERDVAMAASPTNWAQDQTISLTEQSIWRASPLPAQRQPGAFFFRSTRTDKLTAQARRWRLGSQDVTDLSIDVPAASALDNSGTSDKMGEREGGGVTVSLSELGPSQAQAGSAQAAAPAGAASSVLLSRSHDPARRTNTRPAVLQFAPSSSNPSRDRNGTSHPPERRSPSPPPQARYQPPAKRSPHGALQLAPEGTKRPRTQSPAQPRPTRSTGPGEVGKPRLSTKRVPLPASARVAKIATLKAHLEWIAQRCPPPPRTLTGALVKPSADNRPFPRGLLSGCAFYFLASYDQRLFSWVNRVIHHGAAVAVDPSALAGPGRGLGSLALSSAADELVEWHGLRFPSPGAGERTVVILTWYSPAKARAELAKRNLGPDTSLPIVRFDWLSDSIDQRTLLVDKQGRPLGSYLL